MNLKFILLLFIYKILLIIWLIVKWYFLYNLFKGILLVNFLLVLKLKIFIFVGLKNLVIFLLNLLFKRLFLRVIIVLWLFNNEVNIFLLMFVINFGLISVGFIFFFFNVFVIFLFKLKKFLSFIIVIFLFLIIFLNLFNLYFKESLWFNFLIWDDDILIVIGKLVCLSV